MVSYGIILSLAIAVGWLLFPYFFIPGTIDYEEISANKILLSLIPGKPKEDKNERKTSS
jgi:hypothetical protein